MTWRPDLGDPIPMVLSDTQLRELLGYSQSYFAKLKAADVFRSLELKLPGNVPSGTTRYSGRKVADWIEDRPKHFRAHIDYEVRKEARRRGRPRIHPSSPESVR